MELKGIVRQIFSKCDVYSKQYDKQNPGFFRRIKLVLFPKKENPQVIDNVYESGPTLEDYSKQQTRIHGTFKHKFFYPLFFISKKIFGKYLVKEIDEGKYKQFKNLKVFNEAYEKTLKELCNIREQVNHNKNLKDVKDIADAAMDKEPIPLLRTMKEMVLTVAKNDTFYLEFLNIFLFNLTVGMNKRYKDEMFRGKVAHVLFTEKKISEPAYFQAKLLFDGVQAKLTLRELEKNLKAEKKKKKSEQKDEITITKTEPKL